MRVSPLRRTLLGTVVSGLVLGAFVGAAATRAAVPAPRTAVATAATVTAAASAPTCGGVKVHKPTGGYWACSFDEEFSATKLDTTKWTAQQTATSGFHSGPECFVNRPANVSVGSGVLKLTVRKEAAPFTCTKPGGSYSSQYTSGSVSTFAKFTQTYGRFEVRAKVSASVLQGLQESFWLWPADATKYGPTWPASGEIDIAELFSRNSDRAIPFVHYNSAVYDPKVTNNYCLLAGSKGAFHKYVVAWTPTTINIAYDGHTCMIDNWNPAGMVKPAPFDQPFMVALTQALGIGTNAFKPSSTHLPATTQVDYVRVWK
jgi:beta-glucanase (GH16 family)